MKWIAPTICLTIAILVGADRIARSLESVCPSSGTEFIEAEHFVPDNSTFL